MTTPPLNLRPVTPPGSPSASDFSYETSSVLYLFTSLTAGSSHIITATSRLETILKANRVPFKAVDCATDEKARRIWSRRAGKKKLPGLVKQGMVLADLEMVEEWNEFGEIKDNLGGGVVAAPAQPTQNVPQGQSSLAAASMAASAPAAAQSTDAAEKSAPSDAAAAPAQTAQQQQQAQLAREAAALGAQRSKPKPIAKTDTPSTSTTPADAADTAPAAPPSTSETTPRSPPRSPEVDQDYDIDDPNPKHNTSSSAALPPLAIRTNNSSPPAAADAVAGRPRGDTASSLKSPDQPPAPPSTAVDAPAPSSIDAALVAAGADAVKSSDVQESIPEETAEEEAQAENEANDDDGEEEAPGTPHSPSVASDDGAAIGNEGEATGEDDRSPRILEGDPDKHISFQEVVSRDDGEEIEDKSPRILEGDSTKHISFQDDELKGDGNAAEKARESVGD